MRTSYKFIEDSDYENLKLSSFFKYAEPGWLGKLFGQTSSMKLVTICYPTLGNIPFFSQSRYFNHERMMPDKKVCQIEITKMVDARFKVINNKNA